MRWHFNGLSPGDPDDGESRFQHVLDFWNGLSCREDPGETTWGELEDIQSQVSDCLSRDPINLQVAESLTAYAALLISRRKVF